MNRTIYYTATTLDGFIADEHDSLDWLFVQDQDERGPMNYADFLAGVGAMVMGATTYQWIVDRAAETGEGWDYTLPCWVFTHRDLQPMADTIRLVAAGGTDDVRRVHAAMRTAAGELDIWMVGGGDLAGQFADAGLLDEVIVSIAPVTLGAGRPIFPRRYDLELVELAQNRAFVCARYEVVAPRT